MISLDNRTSDGNILDSKWREVQTNNPKLADIVRLSVDNGEQKSLEFYHGYNRALLRVGELIMPILKEDSLGWMTFSLLLAYTEHQIRNT